MATKKAKREELYENESVENTNEDRKSIYGSYALVIGNDDIERAISEQKDNYLAKKVKEAMDKGEYKDYLNSLDIEKDWNYSFVDEEERDEKYEYNKIMK